MAKNVSDIIQDALLNDHINILRLSVHERTKAEKMLLELRRRIVDKIVQTDPLKPTRTDFQQRRLLALYKSVDELIKFNFDKFSKKFQESLKDVAEYTVESTTKIINSAIGIELAQPKVTVTKIKALINESTIDGKIIGEWWDKQADDFKSRFKSNMKKITNEFRVSMLQGESLGTMVESMSTQGEVLGLTVAQLRSLIRTSIVQVANGVRNEVYQNNKKIMRGIRWVSVLDKKTTLICQFLDGSMWDMDGNGLDGTTAPFQLPPAHWNCRSTTVPVILSYDKLKGKHPDIAELDGKKRASMDGLVPARLTYEDWFKTLDEKVQKEILGPGRFKLWQRGNLSVADMLRSDGTPLSLKELRAKLEEMGV